jgi:hypothetical protein
MRKFKAFKLDESGKIVVVDGLPVGIFEENGKDIEEAIDPTRLFSTIDRLGKENKTRREENESLKSLADKFKPFEEKNVDLEKALKAIEVVSGLDEKSLLNAEKVAEEKKELQTAHQKEVDELKKAFDEEKKKLEENAAAFKAKMEKHIISDRFSKSSFFSGENKKTILPPDIGLATFGMHFKVDENDNLVAYYDTKHERVIQSRKNYGEIADFDEAIEALLEKHPSKDSIIKTTAGGPDFKKGGSGARGNNPFAKETFNLTEQMRIMRENPEAAKALRVEAGVV